MSTNTSKGYIMKEHKFSWFYEMSAEDLQSFLIRKNTGARTMAALQAVHAGRTYTDAAKAYGITKQTIHIWLNRTTKQLKGE